MITVNQEMLQAAINEHKSSSPNFGKESLLQELKDRAVLNVQENMWEKGDMFTMPATEEELVKVLDKEVFDRLPKVKTIVNGQEVERSPEGYYALVYVENANTHMKSVKKFRVSSATASFNEYHRDPVNEVFVANGIVKRSNGPVATLLRSKKNQYEQFTALLGKTLVVKDPIVGNAAVMDSDGRPKSVRRRTVTDFDFAE